MRRPQDVVGLFALLMLPAEYSMSASLSPLAAQELVLIENSMSYSNNQHAHEIEKEKTENLQQAAADVVVDAQDSPRKKPLSFYFAFLSLVIMVFIVSIDSTALAVAIPVSDSPTTLSQSFAKRAYDEDYFAHAGQNRFSPISWVARLSKPFGLACPLCCPSL